MVTKEQGKPTFNGPQAAYSSPPCYAHEVDPAYLGLEQTISLVALQSLKSKLDTALAALRFVRFP